MFNSFMTRLVLPILFTLAGGLVIVGLTASQARPAPLQHGTAAQDSTPTSAAEAQAPKRVEDKQALLELQLLSTKRALAQSNYSNVVRQAQDLQAEFDRVSNDLNEHINALYKKLKLNKTEFDINFESGEIIPIAPIAPQKK